MPANDPAPSARRGPSNDAASSRPIRILALLEATTLTGVARSVLGFAEALRPERSHNAFTVSLVIVARGVTLDAPLARAARDAGLSVAALPERRRFDLRAVGHLRRLCARFQPDVIQSHAVKSHVLVWLAGLRHRHVWLAFHHGYTHTDLKTRVYNLLDRLTLRYADHVVTVAKAFRGDLVRCGVQEARLSVLHNAAPAYCRPPREARHLLRQQLAIPGGTRVVAAVGRLSAEKRHVDLIRAFARVRTTGPASHLVIAGDGPERPRLEREIVRWRMQREVTLLGELHDVAPLYQLADLFTLPSATEGCPGVLLEAMAAGVPVVASRVGGIPEVVRDGRTALLVAPGDVEDLASAIARMLLDRRLACRLATAALRHATKRYDPAARAMRLAAIHHKALAGRGEGVRRVPIAAAWDSHAGGGQPCAF
jgi:glycosyltransferase involved in cell wall biosynthesis